MQFPSPEMCPKYKNWVEKRMWVYVIIFVPVFTQLITTVQLLSIKRPSFTISKEENSTILLGFEKAVCLSHRVV
jgi:hypothetical protein